MKLDSWIAPLIVFSCALLLFSLNLDRPPHPDELHHVLAAQHLLETGRPLIGEGEYWRGIVHTWLVAVSYEIFGEGIASARIPAVLFVALVAPILFLWVRREAGSLAAWLTAILFISSPFTVEIAQFSRFYALQMFFFVSGALCFYHLIASAASLWRRVLSGVLAAVLLSLSVWMQETSLVGLLAIGIWTAGFAVQRALSPMTSQSIKKGLGALFIVTGILVLLAVTLTDVLDWIWDRYRYTPLFNVKNRDEFWFYHVRFLGFYATLWSLVGILAVLAVVRSPRLAWFAISIFSISFVLMSFAGPKNTRYLSFAPPFLAIIWGVGLALVAPVLGRYAATTWVRFRDTLDLPERLKTIVGTAAVVVALALVVLTNLFWLRTATMIGNVAMPLEIPTTNWGAAREVLAPWTNEAEIMIATEELGAIYFLGRTDVTFNPSKLGELASDQQFEFGIDFRTGRPTISKPESLERLIECFQSGLVVGPIENWGNPSRFGAEAQAVVIKYAKPIEVPRESHLFAWSWKRERQETRPGYCSDLSRFSGRQMRK